MIDTTKRTRQDIDQTTFCHQWSDTANEAQEEVHSTKVLYYNCGIYQVEPRICWQQPYVTAGQA